jgi:hydroxyacylglutathione hydrolase
MDRITVELVPILSDNYTYILEERTSGTVAVVDPGTAAALADRLYARGGRLDLILLTHHHGDHVDGVADLKRLFGAEVVGPEADRHRLPALDRGVREGEQVTIGAVEAEIIATPGHTSGHIAYWLPTEHVLFAGDTLFALGCGRLLEGDGPTMWRSLSKLAALPEEAVVYCGHEYTAANARFALTVDPDNEALRARAAEIEQLRARGEPTIPTTLGLERRTNPFLRAADPTIRRRLDLTAASDAEVFTEIRRRKDRA